MLSITILSGLGPFFCALTITFSKSSYLYFLFDCVLNFVSIFSFNET